jgi:zinc/manganese transport system ATP-binding protein
VTALQFDTVRLQLGDRTVLRDASFAIAAGEFVGLLGPNGAGKTTLMRAVLGLVQAASGRITVGGQPARRGDPAIGYMPQVRTAPHQRLSGADFIASACGGARWGLPRTNTADRAEIARVLALVQAEELAQRPIADLSGGERQRLLLAQALLDRPALLLLDEPLMSLDPRHQSGVVTLVRRLQRELGVTVLFSAHELNPLLGVMDRVLYLGSGQAALGTVAEVITGPVLTRLYGAPIDVVRAGGRVFVTPADA